MFFISQMYLTYLQMDSCVISPVLLKLKFKGEGFLLEISNLWKLILSNNADSFIIFSTVWFLLDTPPKVRVPLFLSIIIIIGINPPQKRVRGVKGCPQARRVAPYSTIFLGNYPYPTVEKGLISISKFNWIFGSIVFVKY